MEATGKPRLSSRSNRTSTARREKPRKGDSTHRRCPCQMLPSIVGTPPRSVRQGGPAGGSAPAPAPPRHSASSWPSLSGGTELVPKPQPIDPDWSRWASDRIHGARAQSCCWAARARTTASARPRGGMEWRRRWKERGGGWGVSGSSWSKERTRSGAGASKGSRRRRGQAQPRKRQRRRGKKAEDVSREREGMSCKMAASPRWEGIGRRTEEGGGVVIARTNIIKAGVSMIWEASASLFS